MAKEDKPKITNDLQVKNLPMGKHYDAIVKGLILVVSNKGAKKWVLRATIAGKRTDMGLGSYPTVSIAEARKIANRRLVEINDGINPLAVKRAKVEAIKNERETQVLKANRKTFADVAEEKYKQLRPTWRSDRHARLWWNSLENHVFPYIGNEYIDELTQMEIKAVLERLWLDTPETAQRVQQRIRAVIDYAQVAQYPKSTQYYFSPDKANPATLAIGLLPPMKSIKEVEEYRSLDFGKINQFMQALQASKYRYKQVLEFLIYTCVRSGDVRGAIWGEIDFKNHVWTIPAKRLKVKKNGDQRVPLSEPALDILLDRIKQYKGKKPRPDDLIFPNTKDGKINDDALNNVIRSLGYGEEAVAHGFRSTFKTWATETTDYAYIVSERALSHGNADDEGKRDRLGKSYQRGDLFGKRVQLMNDWANYIHTEQEQAEEEENLINFTKASKAINQE